MQKVHFFTLFAGGRGLKVLCFAGVLAPHFGPKVRKAVPGGPFRLFRTLGLPGLPEYQLFPREKLIFWPGAPGVRFWGQNDLKSRT